MTNVGGITVFGGTYPARIWAKAMAGALAGDPVVAFRAPSTRTTRTGRFLVVKRGYSGVDAEAYDGRNQALSSTSIKRRPATSSSQPTPSTTIAGGQPPPTTVPRKSTGPPPRRT